MIKTDGTSGQMTEGTEGMQGHMIEETEGTSRQMIEGTEGMQGHMTEETERRLQGHMTDIKTDVRGNRRDARTYDRGD